MDNPKKLATRRRKKKPKNTTQYPLDIWKRQSWHRSYGSRIYSLSPTVVYSCYLNPTLVYLFYLFPRSGIWAIQPLGPFLIICFHLPVGRYLVIILYPDFSNDFSIGSWKCWLSLSLLLSLVFYSTHPQLFARSYIS